MNEWMDERMNEWSQMTYLCPLKGCQMQRGLMALKAELLMPLLQMHDMIACYPPRLQAAAASPVSDSVCLSPRC